MRYPLWKFVTWWRDECLFFIPTAVQKIRKSDKALLIAYTNEDVLVLTQIQGTRTVELSKIDFRGCSSILREEAVQRAIHKFPPSSDILLDLADKYVLTRTLVFPTAAEENLRQVVQYEMERRTPFKPDEVYFTTLIAARSPETQEIEVALAVVPRTTVDEAVEQMAKFGLRPERVGASAPGLSAAEGVNFLPTNGVRKTPRWAVAGTGALGLVTAGLLIAAILLPLEMKRDRAVQLSAEVAALRKNTVAASRLTDEIDALRARNQFIQMQRSAAQPAIKVLDDLTRLLPDDAWVFQLRLQMGQVSAQGYATAVSALVERIESDPRFRNVAVQSRVTRDPKTGMERFHLTFDLAGSEA